MALSKREFDERVAILRRYREALMRQRDRFRHYLDVLENRTDAGNPEDDLEFHVELERSIVKEIASFERSIEPLETLYRAHDPEGSEIPALREALQRTRDEVLRRTSCNQELLRRQLDAIRDQVSSAREQVTPLRPRRSRITIAGVAPEPSLVDVTA